MRSPFPVLTPSTAQVLTTWCAAINRQDSATVWQQYSQTLQQQLLANKAQTAQAQIDSLRGSVDLATESLRLTLLRYQAGEATALEVVDAQNTLVAARNAYDDGEARYRIAIANLQTLTGAF